MTIPHAMGSAVRPGLRGAVVELRLAFTGPALVGQLFWPVLSLGALFWLRGRQVTGSELLLGPLVLPGLLAMFVAFGMLLMTQYLPADREDGTLLRARATPHGIPGYLIGKLVTATASVLIYLLVVAVPGSFVIGGINLSDISWLTLAWVLGLGLACTQLLGAALWSTGGIASRGGLRVTAGPRPDRDPGHPLPHHRPGRLAADPRPDLPHLLARPRDAFRPAS